MKILIVCCFFFLLSRGICYAQDSALLKTDLKVTAQIKRLKAKKVNTIVEYYIDCPGAITRIYRDSCVAHEIRFLLWKEGNICFVQRFDECFDYEKTVIGAALFYLVQQRFKEIEKADKVFSGDDSCYAIFEIYHGSKLLHKELDINAISPLYAQDCDYCIKNYLQSKKSVLFKLFDTIEKDIGFFYKTKP